MVGVVADAACSETFFLENKSCVKDGASLFGGNAKVEVRVVFDAEQEKDDEIVQCTRLLALGTGCHVLRVNHCVAIEYPGASEDVAFGVLGKEELDARRKTLHEKLHFLGRMNRMHPMVGVEALVEDLPEGVDIGFVGRFHNLQP